MQPDTNISELQRLLQEKDAANKALTERMLQLENELVNIKQRFQSTPTSTFPMPVQSPMEFPYVSQSSLANSKLAMTNYLLFKNNLSQGTSQLPPILPKPSMTRQIPHYMYNPATSLTFPPKHLKGFVKKGLQKAPLKNSSYSPNLEHPPGSQWPYPTEGAVSPTAFMSAYVPGPLHTSPTMEMNIHNQAPSQHVFQMTYNVMHGQQEPLYSSSRSLYSRSPEKDSIIDEQSKLEALESSSRSVYLSNISPKFFSYIDDPSDRESVFSVSKLDLNALNFGTDSPYDEAGDKTPPAVTYQSEFYFNACPNSMEEDMDMLDQLLGTDPFANQTS